MNNEVWPCDNPNRNLLSQELLSSGKRSGLGATFQGDERGCCAIHESGRPHCTAVDVQMPLGIIF